MTGDSASPRVLVVDDAPELRTAIRQMLGSRGYRVDAVGTLAEAGAMRPGEYDAVLVDLHLGSERGTTLIADLTAADPGFASRCLLMSGDPRCVHPGVAALAKPFLPDQLLDAVRALCKAEQATAASAGPEDGLGPPAPPTATARATAASAESGVALLGLAGLLRAHERAAVAEALHDDPVQGLASAILGLHLIRDQVPAGQTELLDSVARQLSEAATSLRGLIGRLSPCWLEEWPAETIRNRTAWLLAAPPVVEVSSFADGMDKKTARFAADVAELALFLASGAATADCRRPTARIRVLGTDQDLDIVTIIRLPAGDPRDEDAADPADAAWRENLRGELASALGADIDVVRHPGELQVRVSLRRMLDRLGDITSYDRQELVDVERLGQELGGARRQEILDRLPAGVAAEDDDRDRGGGGVGGELTQDLLAAGVGKAVVEQDEGRLDVGRRLDAVSSGACRVQLDVRAPAREQAPDDHDAVPVVVDVEHGAAHGAGAVRCGWPGWRSCPAATESSSWPSAARSSGLVR
jgi:CheY-like chemotaxis protein